MDTTNLDDLLNKAEAQEAEQGEWIKDINYITKNFYVDEHGVVEIKNKTIGDMSNHISVKGESYSQYIEFKICRFFDGIDLTKMQLAIYFNIPNVGEDESRPINVYYNENEIKFGWVIPPEVAKVNLTIEFCIYARGILSDGNNYILKTKTAKYSINDGLEIGSGIIEPTNNWYLNFVLQMDEKVAQATESAERAVQAASSVDGVVEIVTTARNEVNQKASTVDTQHSEVESWHQESEQFRNEAEQFRNQAEAIVGIGLAEEGKPGLVQPDGVTTKVDENGKLIVIGGGSGGGGTTDYQALQNKPSIAGIELSGDKSYDELGLASKDAVARNFQTVNQNIKELDDYTQSLGEDIVAIDTELEQTNQQLQSTTDKVDDVQESIEAGFKKQAQGEVIHTTDAVDGKVVEFAMYGKAEQKQYSGKNLLENVTTTRTTNNVTFTVNDDKSVTVNGTASGTASVNVGTIKCDKLSVGVKYIYADNYETTQNVLTFIDQYLADGTWEKVLSTNGNPFEVTEADISNGKYLVFGIRVLSGKTANNVTVYPMLRISTNTAEYEPYTGGIPSPNPEFPQEIETAGASGSIEVKSCGKNLLKNNYYSSGVSENFGLKFTKQIDGSVLINGTTTDTSRYYYVNTDRNVDALRKYIGKKVTISMKTTNTNVEYICNFKKNGSFVVVNNRVVEPRTFVIPDYDEVNIFIAIQKGFTLTNDTVTLQIEEGNQVTEYQPYKETKSLIPTPNGLPGIKVSSGGNYTDENGQQWITDEIVKFADGSGEYIQRIGSDTLGNYDYTSSVFNGDIYAFVSAQPISNALFSNSSKLLCETFTASGTGANNTMYITGTGNIRCFTSSYTTAEEFKTAMLNTNLVYELATYIHTPLTSEQISEIDKLNTFKPITNISNNEQCGMKITYATLQEALMLQEAYNQSKANAQEIGNVKEEIVDVKKELSDTTFKVDTIIEKADLGIKETASGEEIHLTDSAEGKAVEFALYGKAKQNTTTGKNLIPYPYPEKTRTHNGITFTDNGGSVKINGTATETAYFNLASIDFGSFNFNTKAQSNGEYACTLLNGNNDLYAEYNATNKITAITVTANTKVENVTVYPMVRLASITDDTWEQPTNGASPNPQFPQPIEVSGESYNLLENTATSQTINGVTFTVNEDKSVTVNGTATDKAFIHIIGENSNRVQNETLKTEIILSGGYSNKCSVIAYPFTNGEYNDDYLLKDYGSGVTKDWTNVEQYYVDIVVDKGATIENATLYPMIRKASVKNDRYMPCGKGSVEVKSLGKNLLNQEPFRLTNDGTNRTKNIYFDLPPNKYIFECKWSGNATSLGVQFYNEQWQILNTTITSGKPIEITTSFNFKRIYMFVPSGDASGNYADVYDIMISTVGGEYQPYKETLSTIPTENGLAGIKVSSNGNYTDQNGQQWICDEIVKYADGSGEYIQRVVLKNILPSEWYGTGLNSGNYYHYSIVFKDIVKRACKAICNRYIHKSFWAGNNLNVYIASDGFIYIIDSNYPTHAEWVEFVSKNPIEILFELAEPITTPLTAEEITEIEKLSTFYPVTNISNDFDCGMKVTYLADSKNYVDKKLELQAKAREEEMMSMFLLLPDEVQAAMIENDTNNLMSGMED